MRDERVILRERGIRKNYTKKTKVKLIRLVITLPSSIALLFVLQFPLIRLSFDYANTQLRRHLGHLECDAYHHGDGYGDSGPADLSSHRLIWHNPLMSLPAMMCDDVHCL